MGKVLKALERIKKSHSFAMACLGIEQEDTETLEAINTIEQELRDQDKTIHEQDCYIGDLEHEIWKMEDVLKIIKEKRVNIEYIKCCENYEQYCLICSYGTDITEQQFNSLKEELRDDNN